MYWDWERASVSRPVRDPFHPGLQRSPHELVILIFESLEGLITPTTVSFDRFAGERIIPGRASALHSEGHTIPFPSNAAKRVTEANGTE